MNIPSRGGPTTKAGKRISSKNALKHGLTGLDFISSDEQTRYEVLIKMLQKEYGPKTITEELYLSRIASTQIRLDRIIKAEQAAIALAQEEILIEAKVLNNSKISDNRISRAIIHNMSATRSMDYHINITQINTCLICRSDLS